MNRIPLKVCLCFTLLDGGEQPTAAPEWHAAAQASQLHVLEETDGR